ncbi:hypothetical protein E2C01_085420 [Portunus trituberculatus]|uniref:Uncharacterized protein n=1 Tax=Portunus trituberculatus TaxID=210409 RepID=A0A5B7J7J4_PORTR|nr:hypothetical protein [Portunus trituberculatus]
MGGKDCMIKRCVAAEACCCGRPPGKLYRCKASGQVRRGVSEVPMAVLGKINVQRRSSVLPPSVAPHSGLQGG